MHVTFLIQYNKYINKDMSVNTHNVNIELN